MGIGHKDSAGKIFAIVGRKNGPRDSSYLWQYLSEDDGTGAGAVKATLIGKFGSFSCQKEIEAMPLMMHWDMFTILMKGSASENVLPTQQRAIKSWAFLGKPRTRGNKYLRGYGT